MLRIGASSLPDALKRTHPETPEVVCHAAVQATPEVSQWPRPSEVSFCPRSVQERDNRTWFSTSLV